MEKRPSAGGVLTPDWSGWRGNLLLIGQAGGVLTPDWSGWGVLTPDWSGHNPPALELYPALARSYAPLAYALLRPSDDVIKASDILL